MAGRFPDRRRQVLPERVTDDNAGDYSVIITNSYGSVTSVVATLTVFNCTAPPSGLVSWWPMEGSVTDIVSEIVPVATNALSFVTGEAGLGVTFGHERIY